MTQNRPKILSRVSPELSKKSNPPEAPVLTGGQDPSGALFSESPCTSPLSLPFQMPLHCRMTQNHPINLSRVSPNSCQTSVRPKVPALPGHLALRDPQALSNESEQAKTPAVPAKRHIHQAKTPAVPAKRHIHQNVIVDGYRREYSSTLIYNLI